MWVFDRNPTLSKEAREAIADGQNEVFVSAVTAWEIAIKRGLKKLERYIRALGGELEIRAKFPDREVTLNQFTKREGGKLRVH